MFGPSIEKVLAGQTENDVAITDIPFKLFTEGKIMSKVPLITGTNTFDGLTAKVASKIYPNQIKN